MQGMFDCRSYHLESVAGSKCFHFFAKSVNINNVILIRPSQLKEISMSTWQKINVFLNRIIPVITPTSVIFGIIFADYLHPYTYLVPWIFAFMTFSGSLRSDFKSFGRALAHPMPMIVALLVLHVIMPLWALSYGHLVFRGDVYTITGLVLATVIPTGITSFVWVTIYKGNIPVALSVILIDTLLSPFIVPYSLALFVGQQIEMDVAAMMGGLFGMVVLPSILGMLFHQFTSEQTAEKLSSRLGPFTKVGLALVVMINSSNIAPFIKDLNFKLLFILFSVLLIALSGYFISWMIGKYLKWQKEEIISLTFTGGMRNISAGAVIAVTYFPPAVALPVILGMLFQQVLASLYGHLLQRSFTRVEVEEAKGQTYQHGSR